tara:strand:- start:164 stop:808 length:645 start_codon:yes stop_codon:yes gene_type:complete
MNQWELRWKEGRIGFHLSNVNSYLNHHFEKIFVKKVEKIFVPLCGKSIDLTWLAGRIKKVVGVEYVRKPVEDFFLENKIKYTIKNVGQFELFKSDSIDIYHGDYFALKDQKIGKFDAIYDRASIVAIESSQRREYVGQLMDLLNIDGIILLITLEYDQNQMYGPPYSVPLSEVEKFFFKHGKIQLLETIDIIDDRFRKKGLDRILERVIKITKK